MPLSLLVIRVTAAAECLPRILLNQVVEQAKASSAGVPGTWSAELIAVLQSLFLLMFL
jgi:hypothetical protein